MLLLLTVAAADAADAATDKGGASGAVLLGVAAILAALVPIGLALINRSRSTPGGGVEDELVADAKARIQVLKDTIDDLSESLRQCRSERALMAAEAKVAAMLIGQLEQRLADARQELRDAIDKLERRTP